LDLRIRVIGVPKPTSRIKEQRVASSSITYFGDADRTGFGVAAGACPEAVWATNIANAKKWLKLIPDPVQNSGGGVPAIVRSGNVVGEIVAMRRCLCGFAPSAREGNLRHDPGLAPVDREAAVELAFDQIGDELQAKAMFGVLNDRASPFLGPDDVQIVIVDRPIDREAAKGL
jgi:hypothetical protein